MQEIWKSKARQWQKLESDPQIKERLQQIMEDPKELEEYFGSRLEFGTAGLRGEMGLGPNRMNNTVVHQTSLAIARYIKTFRDNPSVVIGYDARNNSDAFAQLAARVFSSEGVHVYFFAKIAATPLLAHTVVI